MDSRERKYKYGRERTAEILNKVDSRSMAEKRSFEKVPEKQEKGFSEMQKFIEKGRCEKLTKEEKERQEKEGIHIWHLPCHQVLP